MSHDSVYLERNPQQTLDQIYDRSSEKGRDAFRQLSRPLIGRIFFFITGRSRFLRTKSIVSQVSEELKNQNIKAENLERIDKYLSPLLKVTNQNKTRKILFVASAISKLKASVQLANKGTEQLQAFNGPSTYKDLSAKQAAQLINLTDDKQHCLYILQEAAKTPETRVEVLSNLNLDKLTAMNEQNSEAFLSLCDCDRMTALWTKILDSAKEDNIPHLMKDLESELHCYRQEALAALSEERLITLLSHTPEAHFRNIIKSIPTRYDTKLQKVYNQAPLELRQEIASHLLALSEYLIITEVEDKASIYKMAPDLHTRRLLLEKLSPQDIKSIYDRVNDKETLIEALSKNQVTELLRLFFLRGLNVPAGFSEALVPIVARISEYERYNEGELKHALKSIRPNDLAELLLYSDQTLVQRINAAMTPTQRVAAFLQIKDSSDRKNVMALAFDRPTAKAFNYLFDWKCLQSPNKLPQTLQELSSDVHLAMLRHLSPTSQVKILKALNPQALANVYLMADQKMKQTIAARLPEASETLEAVASLHDDIKSLDINKLPPDLLRRIFIHAPDELRKNIASNLDTKVLIKLLKGLRPTARRDFFQDSFSRQDTLHLLSAPLSNDDKRLILRAHSPQEMTELLSDTHDENTLNELLEPKHFQALRDVRAFTARSPSIDALADMGQERLNLLFLYASSELRQQLFPLIDQDRKAPVIASLFAHRNAHSTIRELRLIHEITKDSTFQEDVRALITLCQAQKDQPKALARSVREFLEAVNPNGNKSYFALTKDPAMLAGAVLDALLTAEGGRMLLFGELEGEEMSGYNGIRSLFLNESAWQD